MSVAEGFYICQVAYFRWPPGMCGVPIVTRKDALELVSGALGSGLPLSPELTSRGHEQRPGYYGLRPVSLLTLNALFTFAEPGGGIYIAITGRVCGLLPQLPGDTV